MGMEVVGATPELEKNVIEGESLLPEVDQKANMGQKLDEPIQFGLIDSSNKVNGEAKGADHVSGVNFPQDAVDEWPAPKQIHTFYFIKYRSYDDPKLKVKLEQAEKDLQRKNEVRYQITEQLKQKRSERAEVISQLKPLTDENRTLWTMLNGKQQEMKPLRDALGKFRNANTVAREKGAGLCSSEEELDDLIRSLHYRIQHESNTLVEEKQMLKEIKQLEATRDKVIVNAAMRAKIQESMGEREAIQDQVKLIGVDLDGVRKDQQAVKDKIKILEEQKKVKDDKIISLEEELASATEKREKAFETLLELRKARDEVNANFFQNRSLLNSARDLAAKKDVKALEGLSYSEVEKFMSQWSISKPFRDDYEKRILGSLDSRQLSRDGRIRNPDEKPILVEAFTPPEPDVVPVKGSVKRGTEELKPSVQHDIGPNSKVKEDHIARSTEVDARDKVGGGLVSDNSVGAEKQQKETTKSKEIDAAKLKEMKRQEEIAKAKLALERKKKLAEKAAAKAAIRAQKEAEKKLKEKEKRAKKKAGGESLAPAEQFEMDPVEPEDAADPSTESPAIEKNKEQKESVVRRRNRPKAQDQIPKIILKRKKSHPYWMWAAPAMLLVLMLVISGYYYAYVRA